MKRAALAVVVLATLSAQAQDGYFHGATKAGEACSFSVSWGRGLLNNIAISTPSPASCQPEMRAAADAFSKTPPLLWWNVVQAPAQGSPDGSCVMTLVWSGGSPAAATPTFSTRAGGLNGTVVPTQPGCVADAHPLAAFIAASMLSAQLRPNATQE
jgi:hypothetical protein